MKTAAQLGIALTLAVVIAAACSHTPPPRGPKTDEITALWTQIRQWRREAKMPVDPRREDVLAAPPTIKAAEAVCRVSDMPATCGEVCSLADAICDNAEQICILAEELGDDWSRDKCNSAKASCRDAKKRCCQCSDPTKASWAW